MQKLAVLAALLPLLLSPVAALAQPSGYSVRTVSTVSWVEEWDPSSRSWVRVSEDGAAPATRPKVQQVAYAAPSVTRQERAARFAVPIARGPVSEFDPQLAAIASYGPFVVLDSYRAAMIGSTDSASPRAFDAMLRDFPELEVLELVEAPGTTNDLANLAVGRRIRAAGITTHVPRNGSVRSGAVELFLAGAARTFEDGAQFAVHSWLDNYGREPEDFAQDAPANRLYLDYYVEMGMTRERAQDFYAMTNSVPHHGARWFGADEMRFWLRPEPQPQWAARTVHFASLAPAEAPVIKALEQEPIILARPSYDLALLLPHAALPPLALPPLALPQVPMIAVQPTLQLGDGTMLALAHATDAA